MGFVTMEATWKIKTQHTTRTYDLVQLLSFFFCPVEHLKAL